MDDQAFQNKTWVDRLASARDCQLALVDNSNILKWAQKPCQCLLPLTFSYSRLHLLAHLLTRLHLTYDTASYPMQSSSIQSSSTLTHFKFDLTAIFTTFAPTPLQICVSLNISKWWVEQLTGPACHPPNIMCGITWRTNLDINTILLCYCRNVRPTWVRFS